MNCRVSAAGIHKQLPLARLNPAVGETLRRAHREPRGLSECASCPDPKIHNANDVQVRLRVINPRRDLLFMGSAQITTGIVVTK